jgi:hypothetical protein
LTRRAENTTKEQRGKPFAPGKSGNPNGRPRGSRNATTLALESLLDGQASALTQKAIDLALTGDMAALRICLDRILPPRKDRPVTFDFPVITTAAEAAVTMAAVLAAVSSGQITPSEASDVGKLVESYVKAVETADLSARIERLERVTHQ